MSVVSSKLSSKGQVVIPKRLREKLSLKAGDDLVMAVHNGMIIIKKMTAEDVITETEKEYKEGKTLSFEEAFKDLV